MTNSAGLKFARWFWRALATRFSPLGNGKTGLEIFTSQRVDLVILDFAMPEMNGYDVAAEMKRINPWNPDPDVFRLLSCPRRGSLHRGCICHQGESPVQLFELVGTLLKRTTDLRSATWREHQPSPVMQVGAMLCFPRCPETSKSTPGRSVVAGLLYMMYLRPRDSCFSRERDSSANG